MSQIPKYQTVRQIARTGIISDHGLRLLLKQGKIPAFFIGSKALLDFDTVVEYLRRLSEENLTERRVVK